MYGKLTMEIQTMQVEVKFVKDELTIRAIGDKASDMVMVLSKDEAKSLYEKLKTIFKEMPDG